MYRHWLQEAARQLATLVNNSGTFQYLLFLLGGGMLQENALEVLQAACTCVLAVLQAYMHLTAPCGSCNTLGQA